jgi:small-conductance mechanosensitive channel
VPSVLLAWLCRRLFQLDDSGYRTTQLLIRYGVVSAGLVILLMAVGVNPALVAAVGGGLSVGLGFGLKEVVSNFVSGLWLLLEGAVRPGDVLLMEYSRGEDPCEVIALGLRATTLWRDRDNVELVVPNTTFFTQPMATFTGVKDRHRRAELKIGAAYRHPPRQVIALLEQTTTQVEGVMGTPAPRGLLLEYSDSAITYGVRFWIEDPMQGVKVRSDVGIALWDAFQAAGIEVPFPQRVIHQGREPAAPS